MPPVLPRDVQFAQGLAGRRSCGIFAEPMAMFERRISRYRAKPVVIKPQFRVFSCGHAPSRRPWWPRMCVFELRAAVSAMLKAAGQFGSVWMTRLLAYDEQEFARLRTGANVLQERDCRKEHPIHRSAVSPLASFSRPDLPPAFAARIFLFFSPAAPAAAFSLFFLPAFADHITHCCSWYSMCLSWR